MVDLGVELTTLCINSCPFCAKSQRQTQGVMSLSYFDKICSQLKKKNINKIRLTPMTGEIATLCNFKEYQDILTKNEMYYSFYTCGIPQMNLVEVFNNSNGFLNKVTLSINYFDNSGINYLVHQLMAKSTRNSVDKNPRVFFEVKKLSNGNLFFTEDQHLENLQEETHLNNWMGKIKFDSLNISNRNITYEDRVDICKGKNKPIITFDHRFLRCGCRDIDYMTEVFSLDELLEIPMTSKECRELGCNGI